MSNILAVSAKSAVIEFKIFKLYNKLKINQLIDGVIKRLDENQASVNLKQLGSNKTESTVIKYQEDDFYYFAIDYIVNNALTSKYVIDKILHHYSYGGELTEVVALHPNTHIELTKYDAVRNQHITSNIVKICTQLFPAARQYACFDNDFFKKYSEANRQYAVKSYNYDYSIATFDGLIVYSICHKLESILEHKHAKGKFVIINLDLYSSINSIKNFKPIFSEDFIYSQHEDVNYITRKIATHIMSHAVYLNGLDGIVFTGEYAINAPKLREQILDQLGFMGFVINKKSNNRNKIRLSDKDKNKYVLLMTSDVPKALLDLYVLYKVL